MSVVADAEALFTEHQQPLYRYLCRVVGHAETARDLTQDVFVRLTKAPIPDASQGERRAWLFKIARNLALDYHRHQQHEREPVGVVPSSVGQGDPTTTVAVKQALATLADLDRDVFLMREIGGLGYDEIASACDLTSDAVRSRIHRARLELRAHLSAPIQARRAKPLRDTGRNP